MAILPVISLLYAMFALSMASEPMTDGGPGETEESPELTVVEKRAVCQFGWHGCGNRCFKLFNEMKTWSEAEGHCREQGGNLVSIHNKVEAKVVGDLSGNTYWTWIGAGGSAEGFTWYWTDGSPFDYSNWAPWEPNNHLGNEHCASTNYNGGGVWNDLPCHQSHPFVCAK
ncbi:galactose-specific lectin nattectin-like [Alosa sapidissima]|uniref:galactose-specific lectin nattectin-like n=1 Tax=Alosa sapidissima TaxID=34773 RepID=UPI001C09389A|nr:galactose-specific lectin nattectin-like [Alosa sapidissima]